MTTTNMFLNFGGKWDSPPLNLMQCFLPQQIFKALLDNVKTGISCQVRIISVAQTASFV